MRILPGLVLCLLGCSATLAGEETYRAGVIGPSAGGDFAKYVPYIHEAAKSNVDIVVLPSLEKISSFSSVESSLGDNYDELVKNLSEASKQAGLYVAAHLMEKTRCEGKYEMVRNNLVFGRDGQVMSVYRKPVNTVANCTPPATEVATFTTDFGVQFGLMMEEDLALVKPEDIKGLKNFVVTGAWPSDIPYLSASQFASSWSFTNGVNLVSSAGVFAGRSGLQGDETDVSIADLNKAGADGQPLIPPVVISSPKLKVFTEEDLSQYIIRPLNVAASAKGYKETVCHDSLCCEFYIKAQFKGTEDEMNYGLAAFDGVRHFGKHDIGTQTCAVFACAGLYKRTCTLGSQTNSTNVVFEKISINTNLTSATSQYPIILTDSRIQSHQFRFETKDNQVMLEVSNIENVFTFGVVGRDYTKDSERIIYVEEEFLSFNDEMQELFDYLWIRIRILIVVVSIYFLEMM